MSSDKYFELLRNAVYNQAKATELRETLDVLGFNWMTLKEQIKTLKLAQAPAIQSKMLLKNKSNMG